MSEESMRVIERAIDILFALHDGGMTGKELMRVTGLSKPTLYRFLRSLQYRELVTSDDRSIWSLGDGFLTLASGQGNRFLRVTDLIRGPLEQLCGLTGETIVVHVRQGTQRICIEEFESPHPIRYSAGVGAVAPIHVGAAGKALLAFLPDAELQAVLDGLRLNPLTDNTITDRHALMEELAAVRQLGYALSSGERIQGASAISIPVLDRLGRPLMCVSILGPDFRLLRDRLLGFQPALQAVVRSIADQLQKTRLHTVHPAEEYTPPR